MIIDVLSTFPEMFEGPMSASIVGRARRFGALGFAVYDLRGWTHDRHRTTDDQVYGGGQGLLMKPEPVFEAVGELTAGNPADKVVLFSPAGEPFCQELAAELAVCERLIMICGHYEGMDERVYSLADLVISLGDYVLTGGELPAMVVIDAVARLLPGVLGDEASAVEESFFGGLLEFPQYTRPASYRGMDVPAVLLSGDHARVDEWRRRAAIERTARLRPELLRGAPLTDKERERCLDGDVWKGFGQGTAGYTDYTAQVVEGRRDGRL